MEQNKLTFYDDWYVFEDIILYAFRYAIGRHTYAVEEITSWLKKNSHLISKRMVDVMKKDVNDIIDKYESIGNMPSYVKIDYDTLVDFRQWLLDFEKGFGENDRQ